MKSSVIVVGGGLVGTATAWFLRQRDFDVTVVERREACGLETSFANGGLVTPSQSDPWNTPGTLARLVRWLGHEDSPLLLRPRALPGMWRWGWRFLRASRPAAHRHATEANLRLGLYNLRVLQDLRQRLDLRYDQRTAGTLKIFREQRALDESQALAESLTPLGLQYHSLTPAQALTLEPALHGVTHELVGAIHYPADESGDACLFTRQLAEHAARAGVHFLFDTEAHGFTPEGRRVAALQTSRGELRADNYVLAAGSWSPLLTRRLGLYLPVYPGKGYSVTFSFDGPAPLGVPLVDFEHKLVITPLGQRVRIAGTAEFNGYDQQYNAVRGDHLVRQATAILPILTSLKQGRGEHWTGLRPVSCDGPPVLGPSPYDNLYFNTGHGPLGWTLGPGSAALVADRMAGLEPEISLEDYAFARFAPAS